MVEIADDLQGPALLLWEVTTAYDLKPEEVAPYVGVPAVLVNEWFGGKQIPTEDEKAKIIAAVRQINRERRRAMWAGEIYTTPNNPILQEPIRQFVVEMQAKAKVDKHPDGMHFLEQAIEGGFFLRLQYLLFMAKYYGVGFPKLEDLK